MTKPYSDACDQNKQPILSILQKEFVATHSVLEIGSGTGQHAVFFATQFLALTWQPSDKMENHAGIIEWIKESDANNLLQPIALDVAYDPWPDTTFDAVFSANTTHIMSWQEVVKMIQGVGKILNSEGKFCLYGPFNYDNEYTSESNAHFDQWLKQRDPNSGIRDKDALIFIATQNNLQLINDHELPVNNRILVWQKCKP